MGRQIPPEAPQRLLACTKPRYALTDCPAEMPLDTMRDRVFLPTCTILVPVSACEGSRSGVQAAGDAAGLVITWAGRAAAVAMQACARSTTRAQSVALP